MSAVRKICQSSHILKEEFPLMTCTDVPMYLLPLDILKLYRLRHLNESQFSHRARGPRPTNDLWGNKRHDLIVEGEREGRHGLN